MTRFEIINKTLLFIILLSLIPENSKTQTRKFTLHEIINIAQQQSTEAIIAKHRFRSSYWKYRTFKAAYLPSLSFSGTIPELNGTYQRMTTDLGKETFVERKSIYNIAGLTINQNIALTGGNVFVTSNLQRIDEFDESGTTQYLSTPVRVGFEQSIFSFNGLKWDKKIEPLVYEEAKKKYNETLEQISVEAVNRFFELANAQLNMEVARANLNSCDTLFRIAEGRYNIGTIAENDLLHMNLSLLNARTALNEAEINLELQKSRLKSFLGYNEQMTFDLVLPDSLPSINLDYQKVLEIAQQNNPDIIAWQRRVLESQKQVAQAKGESGRNINIFASYGLTHAPEKDLQPVYETPFESEQMVQIGIHIPIVDWGAARGKVKIAQSQQEVADLQINKEKTDFEQNIYLQILQFNLQDEQVKIASQTRDVAQNRYNVTKQRFLNGKTDVLNLTDALKEKDISKRAYVNSLKNYWFYYFNLRQLTLYDFIDEKALVQDLELIVK